MEKGGITRGIHHHQAMLGRGARSEHGVGREIRPRQGGRSAGRSTYTRITMDTITNPRRVCKSAAAEAALGYLLSTFLVHGTWERGIDQRHGGLGLLHDKVFGGEPVRQSTPAHYVGP